MTDKTDSEDWSLARMYHLSAADREILNFCQRIMIGRHEVAWIAAREETYSGEEFSEARAAMRGFLGGRGDSLKLLLDGQLLHAHRALSLWITTRPLDEAPIVSETTGAS